MINTKKKGYPMEQSLQHNSSAEKAIRAMFRLVLCTAAIGFGVNCFCISPLYSKFATDILYGNSWWVYILYLLSEHLLDLAVAAVCFPATLYAVWRVGIKGSRRVWLMYGAMVFLKYPINYTMTCLTEGYVPSARFILTEDLPLIGSMLLLDLLQYAFVLVVIFVIRARFEKKRTVREILETEESTDEIFPFRRLISLRNPLQLASLLISVWIFLGRAFGHFVYQLTLYLYDGATDGLLIMSLDWFSDAVVAVLVYFAALLLLGRFDRKFR